MNLVERLRAGQPYDSILRDEVANRIEQLEREKAAREVLAKVWTI